ncbi:Response regulator receiver domain-containing protein [Candidatus Chrysopegis kryptomonas]|uniref:Response regulator receiver domain-containing protein n=1 Tax=Candidatus Chryseopegocella kryptomonas TaxID=1633643 RepID=A0A0P1MRL5_9BACT|nr:Response regulator receiver domain-containing protein [Candidatus Chrysopegis kryptomonas]
MTLKEFLTILGLQVIEARNGREGIEKAIETEFHILIADYKMPDMTGIEMIREIQKFKRDFKILILTGYADEITKDMIEELGIVSVLQKPIDLALLEKIITQLLANPKNKNNWEGKK